MNRTLLLAGIFLTSTLSLFAQTGADVSGHWEGSVQTPRMTLGFEIDLVKNSQGQWAGTFAQPEQGAKGLPLSTVAVVDRSILFVLKANPSEVGTFQGEVAEDGEHISGEVNQLGYTFPFSLKWTGIARVAPVPKNPPISKELEGTWNGAIETDGVKQRLVIKLANQPDGTAAGTVMSPDGTGVEIPLGITQKGTTVTLDVPSIGASFVGELKASELTGTFTSQVAIPLTLHRALQ